jgi:dienelactone hydrolase
MADVYGDASQRTVLMWHGAQTNARATMRPLAERVAGHGFGVAVPDWNSSADDRGRADLLRSLDFARERLNPVGLVLVGWSLGGVAAAAATIHAERLGVRFAYTVCLAGAFVVPDPIFGEDLPTDLAGCDVRSPFALFHGVADDVVPITVSRDFASTLRHNAWPVEIAEMATDHAGIAGATYDPGARRYAAAQDQETLGVATDVAARIAVAAADSDP